MAATSIWLRAVGTRLALVAALLMLIPVMFCATASARTKVQTVKAVVVFAHAQNPTRPGNCSAVVFVQWPHVNGATAWRVFYKLPNGTEQSLNPSPPFDDTYNWVATYTVPPGNHWVALPPSWIDGPTPDDCAGLSARQRLGVGTEARVELTVEIDQAACKAARATAASRLRTVNRLKARIARTPAGKAKTRLRRSLAAAKTSRAKAVERVKTAC